MNKAELIDFIAGETGMNKAASSRALEAALNGIGESLKKDGSITLVGFGSFSVRDRVARTGRNPRTGEPINIAATKTVGFKPGSKLKETVN